MAEATVKISFSSLEMQDMERLTLSADVPSDTKRALGSELHKRARGSDNKRQISVGHFSIQLFPCS